MTSVSRPSNPVPGAPSGIRRVVAVLPDLFFSAKVAATAEAAGVTLDLAEPGSVAERCRVGPEPALVILDLGAGDAVLEAARALRAAAATRELTIVGFYSHVDHATRDAALAAGVDPVLPRSAFTAKLADLLRGA